MRSWFAWVIVLGACAHDVPQDRATGPDGRIKGARPIALEHGEGRARDVVTYPGGDRIDWKVIELPEGKSGRLDLQMTYTTPRPGLRVTFDVFDQWHTPIAAALGGRGRTRSARITEARGRYFVRVYAPRRGDAGSYKLVAAFQEDVPPIIFNPLTMDVPPPPKLPAVPEPPSTCEVFSAADPACQDRCPPGAPPQWRGCVAPATTPPPVVAPTPPVVPAPVAEPIVARVLKIDVVDSSLVVTVGAGKDHGVDMTWKAAVLRGTSSRPLPGGGATLVRVDRRVTVLKVKLPGDLLRENPTIRLEP